MARQRLAGKVAIVTGSGQGIGREEALLLAREGAAVVINDIGHERETREPTANRTAAEIRKAGGKAVADTSNGATVDGAAHLVNTAVSEFGAAECAVRARASTNSFAYRSPSASSWAAILRLASIVSNRT